MNSVEIRKKFFDFFIRHGHEKVTSSPLIPAQDPTLLFTNAGMNQFKDVFLGKEKRSYTKAVTIQKCMRAGGKHNDLDNVGFTKRHLTFFEMMGNFSFGDYFKKEAISYAWEFLTQDLKLDSNRLVVSVFESDNEAYNLWHDMIQIPKEKIFRLGAKENFWQMGDTGPCGPCTEIHFDRGLDAGCGKESCDPSCDCGRYFEIWNLVFMQFDRQADGSDKPLKQVGVDTGMGFERLCTVMQNKDSVYETDVFIPIIQEIEKLTGVSYAKQTGDMKAAFHVLADHIRACCFAITDGATPSNEGRGYVLRKIIRRAALFERKLTVKSIFSKLVDIIVKTMGDVYPNLKESQELISSILISEIEKFAANLDRGYPILQELFIDYLDTKHIPGERAFKLYDTYGFPLELVIAQAREKGFTVDIVGFEFEMEKQRINSAKKVAHEEMVAISLPENIKTEFMGYWERKNFGLQIESPILKLIVDGKLVDSVTPGTDCWAVTKETPFFVETGGQVDDQGWIEINGRKADVHGLKKIDNAIAMLFTAPTKLTIGQEIVMNVNEAIRKKIMKNHTATHLLQAALIEFLGKQVKQAGSVVTPDYLRFDFTYHQQLTLEQIKDIENLVNAKIMENIPLHIYETTLADATSKGVTAIFGEKYVPEKVRVIDINDFSAELCGGTHVRATGDIGSFKITEVSALSTGTRRIVAVTGPRAVELLQENFNMIKELSQEYKVKPNEVGLAIKRQQEQLKEAQSELKHLKKQLWQSHIDIWLKDTKNINGIMSNVISLDGYGVQDLKEIMNAISAKKPGFYVLFSSEAENNYFVAAVSKDLTSRINLKSFGSWLKDNFNLGGGGSLTMIQGGGQSVPTDITIRIFDWLENNIDIID